LPLFSNRVTFNQTVSVSWLRKNYYFGGIKKLWARVLHGSLGSIKMTKYLIHIGLAILGLYYAIAFNRIPGPFPFFEIFGGLLFGMAAVLYLNKKNRIGAILTLLGLSIYTREVLSFWGPLFGDDINEQYYIYYLLFIFLSNFVLVFGYYISIHTLIHKNLELFELKKLNIRNGGFLNSTLSIGSPILLFSLCIWLYMEFHNNVA